MRKIASLLIVVCLLPTLAPCQQVGGKKPQQGEDIFSPEGNGVRVKVWVKNLDIPWSLIFLPDGRALVSERGGTIRLIKKGVLQEKTYALIDVAHTGEGGLMGLALHPDFPQRPYIYAMHTYRKMTGLYNRIIRLMDKGEQGVFDTVVLENIPGGRLHNGGRISFGPDGMLYIATGEIFRSELAQDLTSLGGKILRIKPDGSIPEDNPFKNSPIFSYGHRNPQGIAWHPKTGDLFISEHGPSGEFGHFAHDEINVVIRGRNYGWPEVIGASSKEPYTDPLIVWKKTTPPSGMSFYNGNLLKHLTGDLFVATLRSKSLIRIRLMKENTGYKAKKIERWFAESYNDGVFGRIRDVVTGPDGALYFLTNNRDGRGSPLPGDDKIYRILPAQ
jgi:quinoprotein glucose dehydrogenase